MFAEGKKCHRETTFLSLLSFSFSKKKKEKDMERVAVVVITRVEAKLESRFMHN